VTKRNEIHVSSGAARGLGLVLAAGVAVRVGSALVQGDAVEPLPGIHDQISYDLLARRVLDGFGFTFAADHWPATPAGEPTAHWSYLYTLYLSLVYAITGGHALAARLIQAVAVGLLQPWLTWRLARRVFDDRTALVAAGVAALYGYFAYYGGALMTEPFFLTSVLWTLDSACAVVAAGPRARVGHWAALGLAAGVTVLLRQVFLLFVPVMFLWLFWQGRRQGFVRLVGRAAAAAIVMACLIAPWTARNYKAFGQFALLNTSAGFAFFWGNHPIHAYDFIPILKEGQASYGELIPSELTGLNEVRMERALLERGMGFVREDPLRYAALSLTRAKEYFKFWPSEDSSFLGNVIRVGSFGLLFPLALFGMAVERTGRGGAVADPRPLHLLYLFAFFYTLIHLLTWTLVRYRLPVDAVLTVFAANGALALLAAVRPGARDVAAAKPSATAV
jgi:4-amino-4-deoxy-L-arabinose transferase-like glycosyltransferase